DVSAGILGASVTFDGKFRDEFLNRQLKTNLRLKGPKSHEETLEHAKEITATFKSEKTPIRACFTNESTLYAQAA
ncbi:hypothetical protein, partial [uncultured Sutterella sp.]|uniref:hypothetical protein n=1 Tax=uncultured Sutterella sp. TaxID=286133 RepID=UPI00260E279C